jgi:3-hydroxyisobutyrate dehydrogenase-like beta-hydroxyacid dehydrogenase
MATILGFIGTGVMGEPICRNLAIKSGLTVLATDLRQEPLQRLQHNGVEIVGSPAEIATRADIIFLSLPGGTELEAICRGTGGLLENARAGQTVVDCSTSPVTLTRKLAAEFRHRGVEYADAPIARTRQAAEEGTLSIMIGASAPVFELIEPLLTCCASHITHCGEVGCGQIVKLMNNMVLFQTVVALAEALTVGIKAGVDGKVLFETLSKGSADSFALRSHGMKSMLPGEFPTRTFSADYAAKDLSYAMQLARELGIELAGAETTNLLLAETNRRGYGQEYYPAVIKVIDPDYT